MENVSANEAALRLHDYETGVYFRPATSAELEAQKAGQILMDGHRRCYVVVPLPPAPPAGFREGRTRTRPPLFRCRTCGTEGDTQIRHRTATYPPVGCDGLRGWCTGPYEILPGGESLARAFGFSPHAPTPR